MSQPGPDGDRCEPEWRQIVRLINLAGRRFVTSRVRSVSTLLTPPPRRRRAIVTFKVIGRIRHHCDDELDAARETAPW
jgi:hypothetical protein